jgi:ATP-binding cassette subfamily C protein
VATDLRLSLLRALLAARWDYYVRQAAGGLVNAFATEAARAADGYLCAAMILSLSIQTILYLILAIVVSWKITLGAAAIGVLITFFSNYLVRKARRAGARQTHLLKILTGRLTDVLYAAKPLKAMAREMLVGPLLERETQRLNRALRREVLSKEMLRALQDPLVVVALTGGLYLALTRLTLSLETLAMLAVLFERTLSSMNKVQRQYQHLVIRESAFWSLQETIARAAAKREVRQGTHPPFLKRAIRFQQVSFFYADQPVLRAVSVTIPARQLTTIVGPSGGGKTSTVDLIIGLVRPQQGQIWIDDVPLDKIDIQAWRQSVGYVPQETLLLHDSVLVNVTLGDPDLTAQDVEDALRAAGAWEFVDALPEKMDTLVGERGARFSGGQRQRIAIARALVHKPQLLILDEATASLDPESEAAICTTVQHLRDSMTILAISHQPALLKAADRVYHLEAGSIGRIDQKAPNGLSRPVSI